MPKSQFTEPLAKAILKGLATAPECQLDADFRLKTEEFNRTERTAAEIWDFLVELKPELEFNDAASAFIHTLIDVQRFYYKPEVC